MPVGVINAGKEALFAPVTTSKAPMVGGLLRRVPLISAATEAVRFTPAPTKAVFAGVKFPALGAANCGSTAGEPGSNAG
ncbi:hypothetical protein D3C86_1650950 [compost metagenome]